MEKIVCALWGVDKVALLSGLPAALGVAGASGIRINLRDKEVAAGAALIQKWQDPQQEAVVQYWLPSANAIFRADADRAIAAHCGRFAAWLVAEFDDHRKSRAPAGLRATNIGMEPGELHQFPQRFGSYGGNERLAQPPHTRCDRYPVQLRICAKPGCPPADGWRTGI